MDMSSSTMSGMTSSATSMTMPMSATNMNMVFYTSTTTPLYGPMWSPTTTAGYAGTCIFLILLAVTFRGLLTLATVLEHRWSDAARRRRYVVTRGGPPGVAEEVEGSAEAKTMALVGARGVEESVRVVRNVGRPVMPWRLSVDVPRAGIRTVAAGVGYLLMLAVMTMNVGYFLSVLAGTLVGELVLGRYVHSDEH